LNILEPEQATALWTGEFTGEIFRIVNAEDFLPQIAARMASASPPHAG
jgi:hypothetical protein